MKKFIVRVTEEVFSRAVVEAESKEAVEKQLVDLDLVEVLRDNYKFEIEEIK